MRSNTLKIFTTILVMISSLNLKADGEFCGIKNTAFKQGEVVMMRVFYTTLGMYIGAGDASFTTTVEKLMGEPAYHCVGEGKSFSFFDNFLK